MLRGKFNRYVPDIRIQCYAHWVCACVCHVSHDSHDNRGPIPLYYAPLGKQKQKKNMKETNRILLVSVISGEPYKIVNDKRARRQNTVVPCLLN